jgi:endonuclease-3
VAKRLIKKEKIRISDVLRKLKDQFPDPKCALEHRNAFELLVATVLSAQCTDVRVNLVTSSLFPRFPGPHEMSLAEPDELEELIRSTGFFRNKTRNLIALSKKIVNHSGGRVPGTLEELIQLPGVARKTANVVLGTWFGIASGIVVDTHVKRLSKRLALTDKENPEQIGRGLG